MQRHPVSGNAESSSEQQGWRALGLRVRDETISLLRGGVMSDAFAALRSGEAVMEMASLFPDWLAQAVLRDMRRQAKWAEEFWVLTASGDVVAVSECVFRGASPTLRFSWNECLREPDPASYSLRGFLSALRSEDVAHAFSAASREEVVFKSTDVARYRKGHYLRRHADCFGDRRFGLVCFFSEGWSIGDGGELTVESADGRSVIIAPRPGTVAAMSIESDNSHLVAAVKSADWVRYSIATHYQHATVSTCTDDYPAS